jgi:hypothetical protein
MALLLLLSGCATTLDLSRYRETGIDEQNAPGELPHYIKDKKRPRVAVLPIADTTQFKNSLNLAQAAQDSLTQLVVASGSVEVMERAQLDSFMQEMKFQAGVGVEVDPDQFAKIATNVDTVFVGAITSAGVTATFSEGRNWTDKKGKKHSTAPSCTEQGKVIINLRALASPSGTIMNSFQLKGQKSTSHEVRSSSECKSQNPGGLLSEAVYKAIDDAKEDVANTFPAFGYVYRTMTDKDNPKQRIAFINLGKRDGLEPGNKVDIIEFVEEKDRVKGGTRKVMRIIDEGEVVEGQLHDESAVLLIPEETCNRVLVGHAIRTKANVSMLRMINKALK